ncbi:hypothetical protein Acr_06g0004660 [Actinidia rufa]|uniref:Uncharacterized protein n=1 Tax=Actinidia rufa TaxID=165716 RepID=A0A7J0EQQ9_9ERIC|nr:hypothetical protein Acr_06g0004660 [Actinidia rufa]
MFNRADEGDSNFLPSWISDRLGEKSYMEDEVTRLSSSPKEDPSSPDSSPSIALPSIEREENIMTPEELNHFGNYVPFLQVFRLGSREGQGHYVCSPRQGGLLRDCFSSRMKNKILLRLWDNWKFPKGYLGKLGFQEFRGHERFNKVPQLFKNEQERLDEISVGRELYSVKRKGQGRGALASGAAPITDNKDRMVVSLSLSSVSPLPCTDVGFHLQTMSWRINLKKLGQKLEESKSRSSVANGVVIGEKHPREPSITSPNKKGKTIDGSKGKETTLPPEAKKANPRDAASTRATPTLKPGEGEGGTTNPGSNGYKVFSRHWPNITLAVVLGSSLAIQSREAWDELTFQQGRVTSLEGDLCKQENKSYQPSQLIGMLNSLRGVLLGGRVTGRLEGDTRLALAQYNYFELVSRKERAVS